MIEFLVTVGMEDDLREVERLHLLLGVNKALRMLSVEQEEADVASSQSEASRLELADTTPRVLD